MSCQMQTHILIFFLKLRKRNQILIKLVKTKYLQSKLILILETTNCLRNSVSLEPSDLYIHINEKTRANAAIFLFRRATLKKKSGDDDSLVYAHVAETSSTSSLS